METLRAALKDLTSTSQTRVKAVASAALSNARDYKVVVHEIEKHLWRSDADKRLAGIYAIDAIVRGFEKIKSDDGNVFAARFALKMPQTIAHCKEGCNEASLKKVLDNWIARGLFTEVDLEPKPPIGAATPSSSAPPVAKAKVDMKGETPEEAAAPAVKTTGAVSSIMALLLQKAKDSGNAPSSEPSLVPSSASATLPSPSHGLHSGPPPLPQPTPQPEVQQHAASASFGMASAPPGRGPLSSGMVSMPPGMAPGSSRVAPGYGVGTPAAMPPPPGMVGPLSSSGPWSSNERVSSFANPPANYDPSATMEPFRDHRAPLREQGPSQWQGDGGFISGAPGRGGTEGDSRGSFSNAAMRDRPPRDSSEFRKPKGPDGGAHPLSKTKMCKSVEEGSICRFGQNCAFAHSRDELRPFQGHQASTSPFRGTGGPGSRRSDNGPPDGPRRFGRDEGAIMGGQHNGNEGRGFGGSSDSFYGGGAPADTSHFPHGHSGPQSGALKRPASPHELHGTSQNGRAAAQLPPPVGTSQEHLPEGLWTCPGCNWRNHPQSAACGGGFPSYGCGMPRPLDGAAVSTRTPAPTLASDSSGPSRAAAPVPAPSPRAPSNPAPSDGVRAQGASQSARPSRWSNAVVPPKEAEAKPIPGPSAPPGAPPGRGAGRGSASVLPAWMTSGLATSSGPRPADTSAQNAVTSQYGLGSHSHANFMPSGQDVSNNANFANRGSPLSNAYAATGLASPRTHGLSNQGLSPGPNQIGHHSQAIGISQQGTTAAPVRSAAKKGGSWGAATGKSCSEVSSSKRIKLEE